MLNNIYIKKLLTDAGLDIHKNSNNWIIGESSYFKRKVGIYCEDECEIIILAIPENVAVLLNNYENTNFVPISNAPEDFSMGSTIKLNELLPLLKKIANLEIHSIDEEIKTDVKSLINQRRGQDKLREELIKYWDGSCAVTGLKTKELLVTSHIKPWSLCENAHEKLDIFNALLLNVALDKAFDQGLISFDDNGKIIISPIWDPKEANILVINPDMSLRKIEKAHLKYLNFHKENIFKQ